MAIAQDGNNKIFQIAFVIVEGEIADAWLFFLNNLKMHVTPQNGLCLISDRHESIKNVYSRHDSGWMPENSMHVRHAMLCYAPISLDPPSPVVDQSSLQQPADPSTPVLEIPKDPATPVLGLTTTLPATPMLHLTDEEGTQDQETQQDD
ncbi:hypothetical protein JHK87_034989 [Glycine soja]|nr:hypothetical protein JHK87_034989 [Glycine soja]